MILTKTVFTAYFLYFSSPFINIAAFLAVLNEPIPEQEKFDELDVNIRREDC